MFYGGDGDGEGDEGGTLARNVPAKFTQTVAEECGAKCQLWISNDLVSLGEHAPSAGRPGQCEITPPDSFFVNIF